MRGNRRGIAALAWGMEYGEMGHYHYQSTRFRPPIYTTADEYLVIGTPSEVARASRFIGRDLAPTTDTYVAEQAALHGWIVGVARG